jgi:AraC-like DNA-binding protein
MGSAHRVDDAEALLTRAFQENHLVPSKSDACELKINCVPLGSSTLSAVAFGTEVHIDTGPDQDFFTEHFLWRGKGVLRYGEQVAACDATHGAVVSTLGRVSLRMDAACVLCGIRIEADVLKRHLECLLGHEVDSEPIFEAGVDLDRGRGARRHRLLQYVFEEAERACGTGPDPCLEEAYLTALLTGQPHSQLARVLAQQPDAGLAAVRRVEDYLHAHPERPIRSEILVALSGVSTSSLYEAFQRERGTSPVRMLRDVRLERVREVLLRAQPGETVTRVALRWGFTHLARFSGLYRSRYGELPSETLRLARRAS